MTKFRKKILEILLAIIYQRKIYFYPYRQTCPKLQLLIKLNDKFVLLKDKERLKFPSLEVNLEKKQSLILAIKDFLNDNISKKISNSNYLELYLIDNCREIINTQDEQKLFVDDLYIKIDLTNLLNQQDLLKSAKSCSLDDIKVLQFKNKFNTLDFKVAVKSQTEKGILIK